LDDVARGTSNCEIGADPTAKRLGQTAINETMAKSSVTTTALEVQQCWLGGNREIKGYVVPEETLNALNAVKRDTRSKPFNLGVLRTCGFKEVDDPVVTGVAKQPHALTSKTLDPREPDRL
jgi:hypothetical protein